MIAWIVMYGEASPSTLNAENEAHALDEALREDADSRLGLIRNNSLVQLGFGSFQLH